MNVYIVPLLCMYSCIDLYRPIELRTLVEIAYVHLLLFPRSLFGHDARLPRSLFCGLVHGEEVHRDGDSKDVRVRLKARDSVLPVGVGSAVEDNNRMRRNDPTAKST